MKETTNNIIWLSHQSVLPGPRDDSAVLEGRAAYVVLNADPAMVPYLLRELLAVIHGGGQVRSRDSRIKVTL